ncbi:hypothetical protein [Mastigocladopsis repens]|nr:hypothetical protein [Mastigocladopsis repens]
MRKYSEGILEQERANRFLERVTVVPDRPSIAAQALKPTRSLDPKE